MKKVCFLLLLSLVTMIPVNGQINTDTRSFFCMGLSQMNYETEPVVPLEISEGKYLEAHLFYDWMHQKNFGFGIEIHKSLSGDVNEIDGRFKLGYFINGNQRVQIPLFGYIGIFSMHEEDKAKYGALLFGGMGGVRIYVTDRLSLQGLYDLGFYNISSEDESLGTVVSKGFRVGLSYYLKNWFFDKSRVADYN